MKLVLLGKSSPQVLLPSLWSIRWTFSGFLAKLLQWFTLLTSSLLLGVMSLPPHSPALWYPHFTKLYGASGSHPRNGSLATFILRAIHLLWGIETSHFHLFHQLSGHTEAKEKSTGIVAAKHFCGCHFTKWKGGTSTLSGMCNFQFYLCLPYSQCGDSKNKCNSHVYNESWL